jgi:hypothetical protein
MSHFFDTTIPSGTHLEKWPMHLTVIPPFRIQRPVHEGTVIEIMTEQGQAIGPIELSTGGSIGAGALVLVPGESRTFGPPEDPSEQTEAVKIVDPSEKLLLLHKQLLRSLVDIDCDFIDLRPEWSGDNYNPHVTLKSGVKISWPFVIPTLALAKKDHTGKSVVATVDMYNQTVL